MNSMKWLSSMALVFLFAFSSYAQDLSGVMMVVKGDVKVTDKSGKTDTAKVGRKVASGDTITAGPDSRAKIVMADKNVINISPDSKIVIEKYENDGKDKKAVELNVVYGKMRANVEQKYDGDKSHFNVKTPSAVAGVRGTDFLTGYNPVDRTTQITTFSGAVAVGLPGPGGAIQNPVYVRPGQTTVVGFGKAPEVPKVVPKEDLSKMNNESASNSSPGEKSSDHTAKNETERPQREPSSNTGSMVKDSDLAGGPTGGPQQIDDTKKGPVMINPPPCAACTTQPTVPIIPRRSNTIIKIITPQ